ncbi:MAG: hypothetical protein HY547_02280 [Elusimicrobia bacterium]|nr:hypothetical protein [Elusimicrobiota bacterium]
MIFIRVLSVFFLTWVSAASTSSPALASIKSLRSWIDKAKTAGKITRRPLLKNGQSLTFNEADVNEFVRDLVAQKGMGKIQSARVTFVADKTAILNVVARVEWSEIFKRSGAESPTAKLLSKLGAVTSAIDAKLESGSAKGKAYARILEVKINGISLPDALIQRLIQYLGEKQKPPMDFSRLFPLPYGIQKIEIHKGGVTIR